eukprot:6114605-Prymnesium_polylepis.2
MSRERHDEPSDWPLRQGVVLQKRSTRPNPRARAHRPVGPVRGHRTAGRLQRPQLEEQESPVKNRGKVRICVCGAWAGLSSGHSKRSHAFAANLRLLNLRRRQGVTAGEAFALNVHMRRARRCPAVGSRAPHSCAACVLCIDLGSSGFIQRLVPKRFGTIP